MRTLVLWKPQRFSTSLHRTIAYASAQRFPRLFLPICSELIERAYDRQRAQLCSYSRIAGVRRGPLDSHRTLTRDSRVHRGKETKASVLRGLVVGVMAAAQ